MNVFELGAKESLFSNYTYTVTFYYHDNDDDRSIKYLAP